MPLFSLLSSEKIASLNEEIRSLKEKVKETSATSPILRPELWYENGKFFIKYLKILNFFTYLLCLLNFFFVQDALIKPRNILISQTFKIFL